MCSIRCDRPASGSASAAEPGADPEPERHGAHARHALRDDPDARVELGRAGALRARGRLVRGRGRAPWRGRPEPRGPRSPPPSRRGRRGRRRGAARAAAAAAAAEPTAASSSTDLPAISGSSARRRPMRPRSRSTSTTRTLISSPLLRTSSTVSTRWPGDTLEMCSRPSVPLDELDERAERRRLDDLAVGNSSPTSTSLIIERDPLGAAPRPARRWRSRSST